MSAKEKLESYLRDSGVEFEAHKHPEAFTAQEIAASEHVSGKLLAKVVMVICDGDLVMAVLPAHEKIELERLRRSPVPAMSGWRKSPNFRRVSQTKTRGLSHLLATCTRFQPTWTSR
jgi:hypothetical protein